MAFKRALLFVFGIGLILLVLSHFGLSETIAVLSHANLQLILAAACIQVVLLLLFVLRIQVLTYGKGYVPFSHVLRLTFSGMFVSMITPLAKLGGEPLKMYMLRENIGGNNATAAIAIESIMELLSSISMVFLVAAAFSSKVPAQFSSTFAIFLVVMALGFALLMKILFTPRWLHKIINWATTKLARLLDARKKDYAEMFSTAFYDRWKNKPVVVGAFSISMIMRLLEILRFLVIFMALGITLPFSTIAIVWALLLVLGFIPWLPGSLGLVEFGGISAFLVLGIAPSFAASGILLDRLLSFWLPLFVGMIAITAAKERGELPSLKRKGVENKLSQPRARA